MCDCDPYNAQTCFKQINVIQNEYNSHKLYIMLWGQKEVVSLVLVTRLTFQSIFYSIQRLKVHTKNLNAKPIINIKEANCFDCILAQL